MCTCSASEGGVCAPAVLVRVCVCAPEPLVRVGGVCT